MCPECVYCKKQSRCHILTGPRASSERPSVEPDRKPPWGELEGDEKDGGGGWGGPTGVLNHSN